MAATLVRHWDKADRRLCAWMRAGFVLGLLWLWALAGAPAFAAAPVLVLKVQDAIGPASADYIVRGIARAERDGSPLVVIQLDTPGGLDTAMRQIIQAILAARVPVATYVHPAGSRAASAGTYILYASHIAAMAPATTLGAATPVAIGMPGAGSKPTPEERPRAEPPAQADAPASGASDAQPAASQPSRSAAPGDPMTAKQVNDAAAFIRGLAQQRGRNAEWAERAVREAVTLTADEALRDKVIDVVAKDVPDLLAQIDGRTVRLVSADHKLATKGLAQEVLLPDWRQRLLSVIANPSFALILMMVGVYGLIFEFSSPGFGLPGTVGAICLLLALFALQLLPVNYAGLALILLGLALMAAEVLSPSFGALGVGGVVAFIAGGILLFDRDVPGLGVPLPLILGLALSSMVFIVLAGGMALRARSAPLVSGTGMLVGQRGPVLQVHGDVAWAEIAGERWRVRADTPLTPGRTVRVLAVDGLTLQVRVVSEFDSDAGEKP